MPPFEGLRGNVHGSSMARWKARGQLPIGDDWTFFASYHGWGAMSRYWSKFCYMKGGSVTLNENFRGKGASPTVVRSLKSLWSSMVHQEYNNGSESIEWDCTGKVRGDLGDKTDSLKNLNSKQSPGSCEMRLNCDRQCVWRFLGQSLSHTRNWPVGSQILHPRTNNMP